MSQYLRELIWGYQGQGTVLRLPSYREWFRPQLMAGNVEKRNERNPYSESYNVGALMGFGYPGVVSRLFCDPQSSVGQVLLLNTTFSDRVRDATMYNSWNALEKYQRRVRC